jgi:hypothetical protein
MSTNDEYEMAIIENETDARICAKLIAEEFALHNPVEVFYQRTAETMLDGWIWPLVTEKLDQKLSFLIRHRSTKEIVAVIIASDLFLNCEKHPYDASTPASASPWTDFFTEMRDQFVHHDLQQKLKPNMVLEISVVATQSKHTGKGIATQFSTRVCDYARDTKGFQYAFAQTNNPATRYIFVNKMNGKEMTIVDPASWLWKKKDDGSSRPFNDYKGEPIVNILIQLK